MSDYSALAQRVSFSIAGIRGCLMLSRDGLILGAHPEGEPEADLRTAWVRFAVSATPSAPTWSSRTRSGRSSDVVPTQRSRWPRSGSGRVSSSTRSSKPSCRPSRSEWSTEKRCAAGRALGSFGQAAHQLAHAGPSPPPSPRSLEHDRADDVPASRHRRRSTRRLRRSRLRPAGGARACGRRPEGPGGREEESEVDRILLAKEFAGLLQVPREDDEASR